MINDFDCIRTKTGDIEITLANYAQPTIRLNRPSGIMILIALEPGLTLLI